MRVAIYFASLSGIGGGAEKQLLKLAESMSQKGHEVHAITWDRKDAQAFYKIPKPVVWHKLGTSSGKLDKLTRLRVLISVLKRHRIQTFIGFVMANNKILMLSCLLTGVKIIAAERNGPSMYWIKEGLIYRWMAFISLWFCKAIVLQFNDFKEKYPWFLQSKIFIIHNPIFAPKTRGLTQNQGQLKRRLIFVGRLELQQKQPDMLISAFSQFSKVKKEWNLRIIGDGPAKNFLQSKIIQEGLNNRVKIIPSKVDLAEEYLNSDLLVIPSRWEGCPNVLTEAMSHGLPAIGFAVDGVKQLIVDGETGYLVNEISVDALAVGLQKISDSSHGLLKMGRASQFKATSSEHSESVVYEEWNKLIESS